MVNFLRSSLSVLAVSLLAQQGLSLVFEDAEAPAAVNSLAGRGDDSIYSLFDRLKKDSWYWHGSQNGHKTLANLTVDLGEDEASIVSMERFRHLLKSVDCAKDGMTMEFNDSKAFAHTQKGWQWVNDDDDRKLVLVAGKKHCSWNDHRTPFVVSSITFDKDALKAKLTGVESTWKRLFRNYELTVGNDPEASTKREWSPTASLSFDHKIPFTQSFPIPNSGVSVEISCDDCKTEGSFDFGIHLKTKDGLPKDASLTLSPNGVSASLTPRLALSGNLHEDLGDEYEIATIPVNGITIPGGVLDLGPQIVFSVGYSIGLIKGSAGITGGVEMSLKDSAELEIDMLHPDVSAGGWTPELELVPVSLDGKIETKAEVYGKAAVQFAASILDHGFQIGVNMKPSISETISASADTNGACADDKEHHRYGANVVPAVGVSINVDVSKADEPEDAIIQ
ncbi:uncharacterized protein BDW47DRAFT_122101 [Aspergillus candidus]|uniref:Uncharacterized protein n=1 Tax=Aspergillus candidus TaxID=41067 RepID=A0A2I2FNZ0_ASPCN|nr:hypothetical protein BDW47DRAFT_122101 [Aspergillus candidus]PLB42338.1 hypothetical protein BDW47DRAFT_122101 [Aspergillus candidus]